MENYVLVREKKYEGKYVAMESFSGHKVVASGATPSSVLERARGKGYETPVLVYIPKKNLTHIY